MIVEQHPTSNAVSLAVTTNMDAVCPPVTANMDPVSPAVTANMDVPTSVPMTSDPHLSVTTTASLLHGTAQPVSGQISSSGRGRGRGKAQVVSGHISSSGRGRGRGMGGKNCKPSDESTPCRKRNVDVAEGKKRKPRKTAEQSGVATAPGVDTLPQGLQTTNFTALPGASTVLWHHTTGSATSRGVTSPAVSTAQTVLASGQSRLASSATPVSLVVARQKAPNVSQNTFGAGLLGSSTSTGFRALPGPSTFAAGLLGYSPNTGFTGGNVVAGLGKRVIGRSQIAVTGIEPVGASSLGSPVLGAGYSATGDEMIVEQHPTSNAVSPVVTTNMDAVCPPVTKNMDPVSPAVTANMDVPTSVPMTSGQISSSGRGRGRGRGMRGKNCKASDESTPCRKRNVDVAEGKKRKPRKTAEQSGVATSPAVNVSMLDTLPQGLQTTNLTALPGEWDHTTGSASSRGVASPAVSTAQAVLASGQSGLTSSATLGYLRTGSARSSGVGSVAVSNPLTVLASGLMSSATPFSLVGAGQIAPTVPQNNFGARLLGSSSNTGFPALPGASTLGLQTTGTARSSRMCSANLAGVGKITSNVAQNTFVNLAGVGKITPNLAQNTFAAGLLGYSPNTGFTGGNVIAGLQPSVPGMGFGGAPAGSPRGQGQSEIGRSQIAVTGIEPVGACSLGSPVLGAGYSATCNLQFPSTATIPQQPRATSAGVQILWEGLMGTYRNDNYFAISRLQAFCRETSSKSVVADWPCEMVIKSVIPNDQLNFQNYKGRVVFLSFRALDGQIFLQRLAKRKQSLVILLPTQTLILLTLERPDQLMGMIFPTDAVVFQPKLPSQCQLQQQQQQPSQLQQQQYPSQLQADLQEQQQQIQMHLQQQQQYPSQLQADLQEQQQQIQMHLQQQQQYPSQLQADLQEQQQQIQMHLQQQQQYPSQLQPDLQEQQQQIQMHLQQQQQLIEMHLQQQQQQPGQLQHQQQPSQLQPGQLKQQQQPSQLHLQGMPPAVNQGFVGFPFSIQKSQGLLSAVGEAPAQSRFPAHSRPQILARDQQNQQHLQQNPQAQGTPLATGQAFTASQFSNQSRPSVSRGRPRQKKTPGIPSGFREPSLFSQQQLEGMPSATGQAFPRPWQAQDPPSMPGAEYQS